MTAPTTPTRPRHTFLKAGHDLYKAALQLSNGGALPGPTDHLAGLAAECVAKAMLIDFFGSVQERPTAKPYSPTIENMPGMDKFKAAHGHMPGAWEHLMMVLDGRRGAEIRKHIPRQNPFKTPHDKWHEGHRYVDGDTLSPERVARHLAATLSLITAYDHAK
ncbi:hypothetical protein [Streptomyces flavochromogenes]|uniref:hypothetical protein n=1 Tax=Streptomyces flavochromogenes TaxID=68199 RepID=UPI0007C4C830|nr:hypothetical protein [Streptomyces flavochromogenes]